MVSERRAELHLAIAEALEKRNEGRLAEAAETLAYHSALTNRTDLAFTYQRLGRRQEFRRLFAGRSRSIFRLRARALST